MELAIDVADPVWSTVCLVGPIGSAFGAFQRNNSSWIITTPSGTTVDVLRELKKTADALREAQLKSAVENSRAASQQYLESLLSTEQFLYSLGSQDFPTFVHHNLMKELHLRHSSLYDVPQDTSPSLAQTLRAGNIADRRGTFRRPFPGDWPFSGIAVLPHDWKDPRTPRNSASLSYSSQNGAVGWLGLTSSPQLRAFSHPLPVEPQNPPPSAKTATAKRARAKPYSDRRRAKVHGSNVPEITLPKITITPPDPSDIVPLPNEPAAPRTPLLGGRSVCANLKHLKSAPGAPVIRGASIALTFERRYRARGRPFGLETIQDDATGIINFLKALGGAWHLSYIQYLGKLFRAVSDEFREDEPDGDQSALLWTPIGLLFDRVDDTPRIFGEKTLQADVHAVVNFLKGQADVPYFRYTTYMWFLFELVATMLASV
ncbi:hypothetical protein B0H16DRAFT_1884327 [Mycena metata]|uniref:Uncharacterized protein n=1 Tax=Mycena metata TaxID=1033252 RepID=A0AAD7JCP5_9AGAR|nr:hypothetical protein B0H16DRAFT_1884327 [Mycena metata]